MAFFCRQGQGHMLHFILCQSDDQQIISFALFQEPNFIGILWMERKSFE